MSHPVVTHDATNKISNTNSLVLIITFLLFIYKVSSYQIDDYYG